MLSQVAEREEISETAALHSRRCILGHTRLLGCHRVSMLRNHLNCHHRLVRTLKTQASMLAADHMTVPLQHLARIASKSMLDVATMPETIIAPCVKTLNDCEDVVLVDCNRTGVSLYLLEKMHSFEQIDFDVLVLGGGELLQ